MSLERWSAQFAPGVINADGLRKLLGASDHDALSLLVRETIQNSWDASRANDGCPIAPDTRPYYGLDLRALSSNQQDALREMLGADPVPGLDGLERALKEGPLTVLEVIDRNTSGLGGPVDNRTEVSPEERTDFVDLVFNIGAPQDTEFGGGTFGFGKVATYAMSRAATIVMISRPLEEDGTAGDSRLIASAIGSAYGEDGIRYTGRHWWGRTGEGTVLPVTGAQADRLARGVFAHAPDRDVTGTTILVIDPALEALPRHDSDEIGLTPEQAVERMVSAIMWSAWPKLLADNAGEEAPMEVEVMLEGVRASLPDPAKTHPFIGFSHALRLVRAQQRVAESQRRDPSSALESPSFQSAFVTKEAVDEFRTQRPVRSVGHAAVAETLTVPGTPKWRGDPLVAESMGITGSPHHLALMRQAELIVRYDSGPAHPKSGEGLSWGGAFRADRSLDSAFAAAEPPTHDRWVPGGLGRPRSTFIKRANELGPKDLYDRLFTHAESATSTTGSDIASIVKDHLSGLMSEGEGHERGRGKVAGTGAARRPGQRISIVGSSVVPHSHGVAVVVDFEAAKGVSVRVRGAVALAGGATDRDTPVEVLGFSQPDAPRPQVSGQGDTIRGDGQVWRAWIAPPNDSSIRVTVEEVK